MPFPFDQHWAAGGSLLVAVLGGVGGWLWRRYRRSAARALQLQSFRGYVGGSVRLAVRRRVNPALARRLAVRTYADAVLRTFPKHLSIPSREGKRLDIEKAYIRLTLQGPSERRVYDESVTDGKSGSVLIFGEPGSGKSSFTRKRHREALKSAYLRPFQSRLPLHLELGRLAWDDLPPDVDKRVEWLLDRASEPLRQVTRINEPGFVFDAFVDGPGVILFLDGLDEVPGERAADAETLIARTITRLRRASENTLVIVTARSQLRGLLSRNFHDTFEEILTVTPFTPADIFAFLRRWDFSADRRFGETQRIFEHLRKNPTLFDMCTNPLVLSMYVAEDQFLATSEDAKPVRLADTRTGFYDQVVRELLYLRREEQRSGQHQVGTQLLVSREELFGRIALDHLADSDDPANSISLERAAGIVQAQLKSESPYTAERDLARLAVETGMIAEQRPHETLQFMHLSLCEYLAGKELAERGEKQFDAVLDRVAADTPAARRLWETVIFAVALSKRDVRERALRRLRDLGAPAELTVRIVREVQSYDLPIFADAVKAMTSAVDATPETEWDAEWMDRVRLLLSGLTDAWRLAPVRPPAGVPTLSTWLADLIDGDPLRLERVFDLYLAASPSEALRAAIELGERDSLLADRERIVVAMENPDMIVLAMTRVEAGQDDAGAWIVALAEAGLRYELAAQILTEERPPAALTALLAGAGGRGDWYSVGPVAGTYFGAVLDVATARRDRSTVFDRPTLVGHVDVVGHVRSAGAMTTTALTVAAYLFATVFLGGVASVVAVVVPAWHWWIGLIVGLVLGVLVSVGAFADERKEMRALAELLNVRPRGRSTPSASGAYLTRFPDGVYRWYVHGDEPPDAQALRIVSVSRWILRPQPKVHVAGGPSVDTEDTGIGQSSLQQAMRVLEQRGPVWCVPQEYRR